MISDTGIIATSLIGMMGMFLFLILSNQNWFKRENFKLQAATVKAENRLKLKKLEKELGIKKPKSDLSNIDVKGLLGNLLDNEDVEEPATGSILDSIPPSLIEGFLDKIPPEKIQEILGGLTNKTDDSKYLS